MSEFTNRVLRPVSLPLAALVAIGVMVFSVSRILLAVTEVWSVAVALAIAATVLLYAAVIGAASEAKPSQRALATVLAVLLVGTGGWALGKGSREIEKHVGGIQIAAENLAFTVSSLTVPAGEAFGIAFDNKDAGIPHNVAIFKDATFSGAALLTGEIFAGPAVKSYEVEPLEAGTYAFRCDVHPTTMKGTLTAGSGPAAAPSPAD